MSSLFNFFASSDNPNSLGYKFRAKRLQEFEKLFFSHFSGVEKIEILDVGGTAYFWEHSSLLSHPGLRITLLNLHLEETNHPALHAVQGNATDMHEFKNGYFDLVFSNSVIEHLYALEAFLHFILTQTKLSRLKKWSSAEASQYIAEIRLLNAQEMKALFPGASLLKEKVLGLTKSITAHNLV